MKSLFNSSDNQEIVNRIQKINSNSKAQWGKMNASQMLAHCQTPIKVAFGELKLKRGVLGILFGKLAKKKLLTNEVFQKNLPTDSQFLIRNQPELEDEKKTLILLIERFAKIGHSAIMNEPHPFFGKLTSNEWDRLQWKHLDHHLRQFGQ